MNLNQIANLIADELEIQAQEFDIETESDITEVGSYAGWEKVASLVDFNAQNDYLRQEVLENVFNEMGLGDDDIDAFDAAFAQVWDNAQFEDIAQQEILDR